MKRRDFLKTSMLAAITGVGKSAFAQSIPFMFRRVVQLVTGTVSVTQVLVLTAVSAAANATLRITKTTVSVATLTDASAARVQVTQTSVIAATSTDSSTSSLRVTQAHLVAAGINDTGSASLRATQTIIVVATLP
ncbi:MAG: hypothetical protein AAB250_11160 [Bdellovibrionota bacterium]